MTSASDHRPGAPALDGTRARGIERRWVTRRDVRRYAYAIGAVDPVHHDAEVAREQGFADLLAPPFFFASLGLSFGRVLPREALGDEGLPLDDDLAGRAVVASGTDVEWFGDLTARSLVEVTQRLESVETKQGRSGALELYTYERTYSVSGQLLVREHFTRIAR
jgi:hydroxyacyl-ACP dehydratase HTD2-like protein with hotdog domain